VVFSFADVAAHSFQFLRDERPFYTPNMVLLTYFAASRQSELPVTVVTRPLHSLTRCCIWVCPFW
jgi:hypothetical protein